MDQLHLRPGETHAVHDWDPVALHLWRNIDIHWYGIAYILALAWGWWTLRRLARLGRSPLRGDAILDFVTWGGVGMLVGGRVGYLILYGWDHVLRDPLYPLKVWEGGMASHGGIAGLVLATWLFARRRGYSFLAIGDIAAVTGPLGIAFGRFANFINGELWGRPSDVPWARVFPHAPQIPLQPPAVPVPGWYDVSRHPSQLYAMALEGLILVAILVPLHARIRRPGFVGGLMLVLYALGRFTGEFFREPDQGQPGSGPDFPAILGFMSKGQAFTVPLLAIGIAIMIATWRRGPRPDAYLPPPPPPARA